MWEQTLNKCRPSIKYKYSRLLLIGKIHFFTLYFTSTILTHTHISRITVLGIGVDV